MRLQLITSILILMTISSSKIVAQIQTIEVQPKGEYADIRIEDQNATIEKLNSTDKEIQKKAVTQILKSPNTYVPPVLYSLSNYLFHNDNKRDAAFWFYTAQLRARYDANRCNDPTAVQAVSVLNQNYGTQINQYGFKDLSNLERIVNEVAAYVRSNPENYDHRWINLHGMGAFVNGGEALSKPKPEWSKIKEETVSEYMAGFNEALASMKK